MSQYLTLLIYAAYPRFPSHPSKLCTLHINLIHLASIFDLMFRTLLLCPEIANGGGRRRSETSQVTRWQDLWITKEFISFRGFSRTEFVIICLCSGGKYISTSCLPSLCGFARRPNCNLLVQAVKNQLQALCGCEIAFTFYFSMFVGEAGQVEAIKSGRSTAITGEAPARRKHNFRTLSRT